jgi:hypothetical protein
MGTPPRVYSSVIPGRDFAWDYRHDCPQSGWGYREGFSSIASGGEGETPSPIPSPGAIALHGDSSSHPGARALENPVDPIAASPIN